MGDVTPINPAAVPPSIDVPKGPPPPPIVFALGDCYVCLLAAHMHPGEGRPIAQAQVLVKGTGLCAPHVDQVANADLLRFLP